jgi:hypothetical protein
MKKHRAFPKIGFVARLRKNADAEARYCEGRSLSSRQPLMGCAGAGGVSEEDIVNLWQRGATPIGRIADWDAQRSERAKAARAWSPSSMEAAFLRSRSRKPSFGKLSIYLPIEQFLLVSMPGYREPDPVPKALMAAAALFLLTALLTL